MRFFKMQIRFKQKLSLVLVSVVIIVSTFLGVCQYVFTKNILEDNFETSRRLVRDRVINILSSADKMELILEGELDKDGQNILESINKTYEDTGNIDFDLGTFLNNREDIDLYIIDKDYTIIRSTDRDDLGMTFTLWSDFTYFLNKVWQEKKFVSTRISLSIKKSEMKKFCYLASSDGQYIFEVGFSMDKRNDELEGISFSDFEESVVNDNDFIDRIILFDYEGTSYKKDKNNNNIYVNTEYFNYFKEAINFMTIVGTVGEYDGRKAYYEYVPYEIIGAQGANERNAVEIIYNDVKLQKDLENSKRIVILVVLVSAIIAATYGFRKSKKLIEPLEKITDGINEIASGNFDIDLKISTGDEMQILADNIRNMAGDIKILLEEQYKDKDNLEKQNVEILSQKEEINALYEETYAMNEELAILLKENENSYFETVRALANAIEAKDSYTGGHCERVMTYSLAIAEELGLSDYEKNRLRFGSILHDIGKIGIPEHILNYSGRFSDEDYEVMKKHPEIGGNILKELRFLNESVRIVYEHHERVDGKGYPKGLKGDKIDILSKIVCVADAYDAMTSSRPYRKESITKEMAIQELIKNSGTQFDEEVVKAFIVHLNKESE